jgi:chemotaxis methyl-accepting protein methylase
MSLLHVEDPLRYVRLLEDSALELEALFRDLLVGVTSFFRDEDAWRAFEQALSAIVADRPEGQVLRAWVAGCSTGEEAYSLAILLRECTERAGRSLPVQIFATDLDDESIEHARAARYPLAISADVEATRLERFFKKASGAYQVDAAIREMVVFAPHSILRDPPFTRLDVVVCRNLLVHLEVQVQRRLLPMFRHALRRDGLLFLGPSETTSEHDELFAVVDERWSIFQRKDSPSHGLSSERSGRSSLVTSGSLDAHARVEREAPRFSERIEALRTRSLVPGRRMATPSGVDDLRGMNEHLLRANEQLASSKEEAALLNADLRRENDELRRRVDALSRGADDLARAMLLRIAQAMCATPETSSERRQLLSELVAAFSAELPAIEDLATRSGLLERVDARGRGEG